MPTAGITATFQKGESMRKLLLATLFLGCSTSIFAADSFEITGIEPDGALMINGMLWKPHTACKGLQKGDRVIFIEGNENGDCVSATISDVNKKISCKLWCEDYPDDT